MPPAFASPHPRRIPGFWLLFAVLTLAAGLGLRDPSPPDEPRFVLAAQHMVESGDWLVPMRGREVYAEKPPVFMWLQAASYLVVRDWRVAFLLPSLLAALGTLWLVWDLAARLWGPRYAPYAAGALWVCVQFGLQASRAQIDMVLVLLTTLSLWGLLRHLLQGPAWRHAWLGAFAAGLGTVTKGVGFLPLLVLLPWLVARRRLPRGATAGDGWRWGTLVLAFVAGTAVWLGPLAIAVMASEDPGLRAYASELLFRQTGERYANAWHHVKPAWYYLQVIATLWLPGALLLPWLLPAWGRRLRRGDPRFLLLLGWAILVWLFFSASPGKREVYIFPALPILCVAAAPLLPGLLRRRAVRATLFGWLLLFSTVFVALGASALLGGHGWAERIAMDRAIDSPDMQAFLLWILGLGLAGLALAAWGRLRRIGVALSLFMGLLWMVHGIGLAPALDRSSSARGLMAEVGRQIDSRAELGLLAWNEQQMLQADRPVVDFGYRQPWHRQWQRATAWLAAAPERRWILLPEPALGPCVDRTQARDVGRANRSEWWVVPGTAVREGCVVPPFASTKDAS
jgi:4-amino-4-deoxy-L-arabinose transferase-like glycosyltransferase